MALQHLSSRSCAIMSVIVVPTVHHTGTKFVYNDLLGALSELSPQGPEDVMQLTRKEIEERPFRQKVRIHCEECFVGNLRKWCKEFPSIVPLRHPRTMAKAWKFRDKSLDWLNKQWGVLQEEVDIYEPLYLPLDVPDRDLYLSRINFSLGLNLKTDWSNKWSCGFSAELDEADEEKVKSAMSNGFFEQFGYKRN